MPRLSRSDREHLKILAICHYVLSAFCLFFGFLPLIYLALGVAIVFGGMGPGPGPDEMFGWIIIIFGGLGTLFYWSLSVGMVVAARSLTQYKRRTFCLFVAGASCLFQPLGLVLGIFTILVLVRPSVSDAFHPVPEVEEEELSEYDRYYHE